jgi:hypothetical protein
LFATVSRSSFGTQFGLLQNSAIESDGFIVEGMEGPLKDCEEQRAAEWAKEVQASISDTQPLNPSARMPKL